MKEKDLQVEAYNENAISEGNGLIAGFMNDPCLIWDDPDPIKGNDYQVNSIEYFGEEGEDQIALINYGGGSEAEVYVSELVENVPSYHLSWDAIMPVVEKASNIAQENEWHEWVVGFEENLGTFLLRQVWYDVVEFIKWYNNQNK